MDILLVYAMRVFLLYMPTVEMLDYKYIHRI